MAGDGFQRVMIFLLIMSIGACLFLVLAKYLMKFQKVIIGCAYNAEGNSRWPP